jgi:hypothetical protein
VATGKCRPVEGGFCALGAEDWYQQIIHGSRLGDMSWLQGLDYALPAIRRGQHNSGP